MAVLSTNLREAVLPRLEQDTEADSLEEFESQVKGLLTGEEVQRRSVEDEDFVYEADDESGNYSLTNEAELGLEGLPGMDSVEKDHSAVMDNYGGIDRVGVSSDGRVTLEMESGGMQTYFLAGAYQGQAAVKDDNGIIWKYDKRDDTLEYLNTEKGWVESDSDRHKSMMDKIVDFQHETWAVERAVEEVRGWSHDSGSRGIHDRLKSRFDMVMTELAQYNDGDESVYEADKSKNVTPGGAKGTDVVKDFDEASERFRAYGLLEYGIDVETEVEVAGDYSEARFAPEGL
ncbi:hypothetical protein [Candidatus Nanohalovita haloferacivicina]|uniref:hypothetical protein n=1 Tax=Candidatus Nanohalovita haloferacivicina TaxID=2978046 RepID=UPI00325FD50F|nr:hypothetical protein HBNXNv_0486 [Candidatus Nanohalobia archaeon BNXNv]